MLRFLISVGLIVAASDLAAAQGIVGNVRDLPYDLETVSCEDVIRFKNHNRISKSMAASLYAHGQIMGRNCFRPDYVKSFELYFELGNFADPRAHLTGLETKAAQGNPSAKSHIRKLEQAGLIEKLNSN